MIFQIYGKFRFGGPAHSRAPQNLTKHPIVLKMVWYCIIINLVKFSGNNQILINVDIFSFFIAQYYNIPIYEYSNISIFQYLNIPISQYLNNSIISITQYFQYFNNPKYQHPKIQIFQYFNFIEYHNILIYENFNVQIFQCTYISKFLFINISISKYF